MTRTLVSIILSNNDKAKENRDQGTFGPYGKLGGQFEVGKELYINYKSRTPALLRLQWILQRVFAMWIRSNPDTVQLLDGMYTLCLPTTARCRRLNHAPKGPGYFERPWKIRNWRDCSLELENRRRNSEQPLQRRTDFESITKFSVPCYG